MSDLISRAEAIEAVKNTKPIVRSTERNWGKMIADEHSKELVKAIKSLPSAETHDKRTETHGVCSDLISRADAIEVLAQQLLFEANTESPYVNDDDIGEYRKLAEELFEYIPSAEAPYMFSEAYMKQLRFERDYLQDFVNGQWIPCSERLPKEKQEVYVTVYFIEGDTGRAYGYMDGFGKWHLCSTVEGTLNSGYEVLAWMPLPKPYKGGDDE